METLSIDIETYSSVDLKSSGLFKYAESDDFEILLFAYKINDEKTQIIDTYNGTIPTRVLQLLENDDCIKYAWNATFEWVCINRYLKQHGLITKDMNIKAWRDTMVKSLYCGYPAALGAAGKALRIPDDKAKMAAGKALINYFCKPVKATRTNGGRTRNLPAHDSAKWELFKEYCINDVEAEYTINKCFSDIVEPEWIWGEWHRDVLHNARGIAADTELINSALEVDQSETERLITELAAITGLSNPNSNSQLLEWINNRDNKEYKSVAKEALKTIANDEEISEETKHAINIKLELSKTSVAKYKAMQACLCKDNRIRGTMQFYGAARTGREAGRLIQVQNLPRTYIKQLDEARAIVKTRNRTAVALAFGNVKDTLSQLIRTALIAKEGCIFMDADFSAIEARVLAWLANEQWVLDVFRTHGKIYEANAARMFNVPLEKIVKGEPEYELRQSGKVAQLALGYGGGVAAIDAMDFNNDIPEADRPDIVKRWRRENPNIVRYWKEVEQAATDTVLTGHTNTVGACTFRSIYTKDGVKFLTITLPSGRALCYPEANIGTRTYPDGRTRSELQYKSLVTQKWVNTGTYGGKLVENITQAVARDILFNSLKVLDASGYNVVFHIHDEVVVEIEEEKAELQNMYTCMEQLPKWAVDFPLDSDGWKGYYFTKD